MCSVDLSEIIERRDELIRYAVHFLRKFSIHETEAEDVYQTVCLKLLNGQRHTPTAQLAKSAIVTHILDIKKKRLSAIKNDVTVVSASNPNDYGSQHELESVESEDETPLYMRYDYLYEEAEELAIVAVAGMHMGYTIQEIADALDVKEWAVRHSLDRFRKKLRTSGTLPGDAMTICENLQDV